VGAFTLTVAIEKHESDEHEQRVETELLFCVVSIPFISAAIDSHPHADHDRTRHK